VPTAQKPSRCRPVVILSAIKSSGNHKKEEADAAEFYRLSMHSKTFYLKTTHSMLCFGTGVNGCRHIHTKESHCREIPNGLSRCSPQTMLTTRTWYSVTRGARAPLCDARQPVPDPRRRGGSRGSRAERRLGSRGVSHHALLCRPPETAPWPLVNISHLKINNAFSMAVKQRILYYNNGIFFSFF